VQALRINAEAAKQIICGKCWKSFIVERIRCMQSTLL